jgi:SAM-dependent methyltransferase
MEGGKGSRAPDWLAGLSDGEVLALLYDADHPPGEARLTLGVDRVLELLGGPPARVLELCSGTGRVLAPLARAGFEVTGVDRDPHVLELARRKLAAAGAPEPRAGAGPTRATLIHGDALETDPHGHFDAVLILLNSIMCLGARERQLGLVKRVHRILRPGGLFVVETLDPDRSGGAVSIATRRAAMYPERLLEPPSGRGEGVPYRKRQLFWGADRDGRERTALTYELGSRGSVHRRVSAGWRWRWLGREELRGWLQEAGFEETKVEMVEAGGYRVRARKVRSP